jgi:hypothetical protein
LPGSGSFSQREPCLTTRGVVRESSSVVYVAVVLCRLLLLKLPPPHLNADMTVAGERNLSARCIALAMGVCDDKNCRGSWDEIFFEHHRSVLFLE